MTAANEPTFAETSSDTPPARDIPLAAAPSQSLVRESAVMAVYDSHLHAAEGIKMLQRAGLDMRRLSLVVRDVRGDDQAVGLCATGDRVLFGGGQGAFWEGVWGVFFGGAIFFCPVVGHVVVLGPMVDWMVRALEGAAPTGARGVFGEALASVGIPETSVTKYQAHLATDRYLVMARGSARMVHDVRWVLDGSGASSVTCHDTV